MRIDWYIESDNDDGSQHYAMTEGELPREGSTVYFRDDKMRLTHGTVTRASICVGKGEVSIDRIELPEDLRRSEERIEFVTQWIERECEGIMQSLSLERRTISYATQRGEVTVKMTPPPGTAAPEKKE